MIYNNTNNNNKCSSTISRPSPGLRHISRTPGHGYSCRPNVAACNLQEISRCAATNQSLGVRSSGKVSCYAPISMTTNCRPATHCCPALLKSRECECSWSSSRELMPALSELAPASQLAALFLDVDGVHSPRPTHGAVVMQAHCSPARIVSNVTEATIVSSVSRLPVGQHGASHNLLGWLSQPVQLRRDLAAERLTCISTSTSQGQGESHL